MTQSCWETISSWRMLGAPSAPSLAGWLGLQHKELTSGHPKEAWLDHDRAAIYCLTHTLRTWRRMNLRTDLRPAHLAKSCSSLLISHSTGTASLVPSSRKTSAVSGGCLQPAGAGDSVAALDTQMLGQVVKAHVPLQEQQHLIGQNSPLAEPGHSTHRH